MSKNKGNLKEAEHGKTRSAGAALELTSSSKWGVAGMQNDFKKKELKERRTGRKRVNLSRGGMRKREKSKGKINTRVLPVIFLLGDRINILLS